MLVSILVKSFICYWPLMHSQSTNSRFQLNLLSRTCFCPLTCSFKPLHGLHKSRATVSIREIVELEIIPARYITRRQLYHHLQIVSIRSLLHNLEQYQTFDEIIFVMPYSSYNQFFKCVGMCRYPCLSSQKSKMNWVYEQINVDHQRALNEQTWMTEIGFALSWLKSVLHWLKSEFRLKWVFYIKLSKINLGCYNQGTMHS